MPDWRIRRRCRSACSSAVSATLPAAGERTRIHQQAIARIAHIECPQVEAVFVVVTGAQVGDQSSIGRDLHATQIGAGEIGRGKQAFQRKLFGLRWCRGCQ
jgi:hypothetical protein